MSTPTVYGHCDPRFGAVRERFLENFRERDEIGAAVAVVHGGERVVDLWAGHADPARTRPWQKNTLVHVYSTTKGMTALAAHRLADQGKLDLDAPVAEYWPEFAQAGKTEVPVRWLLCHRAGLQALRAWLPPESLYDWDAVCAALAAETPWFTPGEGFAYQPVTYGWLVGEVVRRVSGRSLGTYFREEIAEPLGADFHIGLRDSELTRCADITTIEPPAELKQDFASGTTPVDEPPLALLAFANPMGTGDHNCEAHRRAEIPAINGHGGARGLAEIYGALANGGCRGNVSVLSKRAVDALSVEHASGTEATVGMQVRVGPGFMLNGEGPDAPIRFTDGAHCFGHSGAGGSAAFADPDAGLGFAYVCNRLGPHLEIDPRARALIDACKEAL
jgi:CubicO group peptidase (beta-lactamase class C family)